MKLGLTVQNFSDDARLLIRSVIIKNIVAALKLYRPDSYFAVDLIVLWLSFTGRILCLQVEAKTAELKQQYEEKLSMKEELRKKAEFNEMMLDRASQLVDGLAGERERWLLTVKDLEERLGFLVGDVLIASAFLSYMGPFLSNYREETVQKQWLAEVGVVF